MCRTGPLALQLKQTAAKVLESDFEDVEAAAVLARAAGPFDLVHAHPFASRQVGLLVAHAFQIPFILTIHGMYDDGLPKYSYHVDAVVAVSAAIRDRLVRQRACNPENIFVIPNGVDTALFRPSSSETAPAWPDNHEGKRILFVSRLDHDKQFILDVLVETWQEQQRLQDFELFWCIAGDGSAREALESSARALALAAGREMVRFVGWQDEPSLAHLYACCHLAVAPGRSALEGMACERPVVAIGSRFYVGVVDSSTVLVAAYGNFGGSGNQHEDYQPGAMYRDIDRVIHEPLDLMSLGKIGTTVATAFFSQDDLDARLLNLYQVLCAMKSCKSTIPEMNWQPWPTPPLSFLRVKELGILAHPWCYPANEDRNVSIDKDGQLIVRFQLFQDSRFYIQTEGQGFADPPINHQAWHMDGDNYFLFELPAYVDESAHVDVWVIQYDSTHRLEHSLTRIVSGINKIELRSSPTTNSFRIALRFAGQGTAKLGPISAFRNTSKPPRRVASNAAS